MARQIGFWAGIALVYLLLGWLGSLLALKPSVVAALWPPAGWALAVCLLWGPAAAPGIWLGACIDALITLPGSLTLTPNILVACAVAAGATVQASLGAWLVQRQGFRPQLDRVEDVFYLLMLGGLVASLVNATVGTSSLTLGGFENVAQWKENWLIWWLGDTLGVMVIAPVCFVLARGAQEDVQRSAWEMAIWLACLLAVTIGNLQPYTAMPFFFVPVLVWAALRMSRRVTVLAVAGVSFALIYATHEHMGPFEAGTRFEALLSLHRFLASVALPTLVLMAALATQREKEQDLRNMTLRLQELDKLKSNFVSSVSHELRTPLTSIMGYSEFLEDGVAGPLNPEQAQFVKQIQGGAQRLQRLVDDLLDFARMDAGTFRLRLLECDMCDKLSEVVESLKPLVKAADITLELACPGKPLRVEIDPQRIEQVLINLLTNAVKFSAPGASIQVTLSVEGDQLRCAVQDHGSGIAPDELPRLFQRFSRLSLQRSGTGLGLSISRALVEAHGGTMGVESEVGAGSNFWFTLPLTASQTDVHTAAEPPAA